MRRPETVHKQQGQKNASETLIRSAHPSEHGLILSLWNRNGETPSLAG
jgi:hypothetical protein